MDIEAQIDGLYRIPLADFTAARNELAGRLQKAGLGPDATRVKALAKPSAAAWAANQVYWKARPAFDRLVDAAGHLRDALAAGVPGPEARRAMQARNDAFATAVAEAERALADAGHGVSPAVLRRVRANLEALAARASSAVPGRLAEDLDPPGLDVLAGLSITEAPRQAGTPGSAAESDEAAGRRVWVPGEKEERQREADAASAAHAESVRRLVAARAEAEEARRTFERAEAQLREAEASEARARAAQDAARRALQD